MSRTTSFGSRLRWWGLSKAHGQTARQLCGGEAPVVAAEPCAQLLEILEEGVDEGEEEDLNAALLGVTEAYGITPASLAEEEG